MLCLGSGYLHFAHWINQYQFGCKMSSAHRILYFSNTKCNFLALHWTCDLFFKSCSVNIKIAHLTSKSLIFVLCLGSGYLHFAHWINQCQFGYKRSSAHRISYFSNTKCNFVPFPGTCDWFFKSCSVNIKITHLTSKSLIFVLCSGSGYLHFAHWINQCQFGYKMSSMHRISYFRNTKCNFGAMPGTSDQFFKNYSVNIKITHLTSKSLIFVLCLGSGYLNFCALDKSVPFRLQDVISA